MSVAIVLGGGGAKGDFEVGAVRFLYDQGIRPDIICGTSVGAINGAKLAEGEGAPDQGLQGLEGIWLSLQTNTDMYLENDWLNRIDKRIKDSLMGYLVGGIDEGKIPSPPGEIHTYTWGWVDDFLTGMSRLPWLVEDGAAILTALQELTNAKSVFNLLPIQWRLEGNPQQGIPKQLYLRSRSQRGVRGVLESSVWPRSA